ncbi:MAG: hypothetical protein KBG47_00225 [Bacteroidia bacterium]|jgi:hypothetical protein|nr:hypothetical protein [Sphingobacteriaceae bacterium]MBK7311853.1 hypothetical protein [Sphingobacteriaceae bacterium]MBP9067901.1 hypothetical protein [Bacteroidia bacterium]
MIIKQFFILATCLALFGCSGSFSKGVKKDLSTGLTATYNGLTLSEIYLVVDEQKANSNKIVLGKKVIVVANGVDYFTVENGKVFPGCSIVLTDKKGKELLNLPDAFGHLNDGTSASEAATLQAELNTGEPMLVDEKYLLKVRFYDKRNKENEIKADITLLVVGL